MRYEDFEGYTKPYVIIHNTGFGVMEAPYEEHGPVGEADTYEEAQSISDKFLKANNSKEDIRSSWIPNTYHIHVNTLSEKGKELLKEFELDFAERLKNAEGNSEYSVHKVGGQTVFMKKNKLFDDHFMA